LSRFFHPLISLLASMTRNELARQVQYLKAENQILRAKLPRRITVTPREQRRLLKLGRAVGSAIKHLISIVSHRTFLRWASGEKAGRKPGKPGRRKTQDEIRDIILRLARDNGWGYTRIHGELRKLGVCRSTIKNILKAEGLDPGPKRGEGTWDEFIRIHAKTLWACDFVSKKVWTNFGRVEFFILFFIHIGTRRVFLAGATPHPNAMWMAQQARNFSMHAADIGLLPSHLIRDRDGKFTEQFDAILTAEGVDIVKLPPASPNLNAFAERWAQTLQHEALDHFVVLGERHLQVILSSFVAYYHSCRPHQSLGNKPPVGANPNPPREGKIVCEEHLGGLLKHYYRKAA